MKIKIILVAFASVFVFAGTASALGEQLFDSTDAYTGACQLTNESTWTLDKDLNVGVFEMWYKWDEGETTLPITISKDGQEFATITATRASCDTYQKTWCNADYAINKMFPKGTYTTKIFNAKQCLKPGGTGAIRLYAAENTDINRTSPEKTTRSRVGMYAGITAGVIIVGFALYYLMRKKSK